MSEGGGSKPKKTSTAKNLVAGGLAGVCCWVASRTRGRPIPDNDRCAQAIEATIMYPTEFVKYAAIPRVYICVCLLLLTRATPVSYQDPVAAGVQGPRCAAVHDASRLPEVHGRNAGRLWPILGNCNGRFVATVVMVVRCL